MESLSVRQTWMVMVQIKTKLSEGRGLRQPVKIIHPLDPVIPESSGFSDKCHWMPFMVPSEGLSYNCLFNVSDSQTHLILEISLGVS